jgi:hypothetical protein
MVGGPALSFVLLMLGVHLFDDWKLGNIAAGQMKLHRSLMGLVETYREVDRLFLAIKRLGGSKGASPSSGKRTQIIKRPPRLKLLDQTTRRGNRSHRRWPCKAG